MEQKKKNQKKWLLKNSLSTNISIILSSLVLIVGSLVLNVPWMGYASGVILIVQSGLNIFALQQELSEEEVERQARALVRLFIKMKLDKHSESSSEAKEALSRLLNEKDD